MSSVLLFMLHAPLRFLLQAALLRKRCPRMAAAEGCAWLLVLLDGSRRGRALQSCREQNCFWHKLHLVLEVGQDPPPE